MLLTFFCSVLENFSRINYTLCKSRNISVTTGRQVKMQTKLSWGDFSGFITCSLTKTYQLCNPLIDDKSINHYWLPIWDALEDAHMQHLCWNPNGGVIIKHWLIWIRVNIKHHQILSRDSLWRLLQSTATISQDSKLLSVGVWVTNGTENEQIQNNVWIICHWETSS